MIQVVLGKQLAMELSTNVAERIETSNSFASYGSYARPQSRINALQNSVPSLTRMMLWSRPTNVFAEKICWNLSADATNLVCQQWRLIDWPFFSFLRPCCCWFGHWLLRQCWIQVKWKRNGCWLGIIFELIYHFRLWEMTNRSKTTNICMFGVGQRWGFHWVSWNVLLDILLEYPSSSWFASDPFHSHSILTGVGVSLCVWFQIWKFCDWFVGMDIWDMCVASND